MTPRRLFYTLRARKSRGQREQKRDATEAADHCPTNRPAQADADGLPLDAAPETNSERTANLLRGVWPKNLKPNAGSRYHPPAGVYPPESVERFFSLPGQKAEQRREDASGQLAHNWQGTANTGRGQPPFADHCHHAANWMQPPCCRELPNTSGNMAGVLRMCHDTASAC